MLWALAKALWRDEDGQATTEYILMLAIIMTMLLGLIKKMIQPAFQKLQAVLEKRIQGMFQPQALHRLNLGGG